MFQSVPATLTRSASEGQRVSPRWRFGLVLGLAVILTATPALAQKPLRWKLKPGDQLQVNIEQRTLSTIAIASKPPVKTTLEMTLETLWSVDSTDENQIKMTQTVKRVVVKLQSGDSTPIAYDSAAAAAPVGTAKDFAAAVKPLLEEGSALMVTMDPRGEVLSAEPSAKLAGLWKTSSPKGISGPSGSTSTQELLKRSMVLLPEKPVEMADAGKTKWTKEREIEIPIGKVKQTTDFAYAGKVEESGQKLDKIDFTSKLTLVPGGAKSLKLTLKKQEQTGHALFSVEEGRVIRSEQTQRLVTEAPYRETNITVAVESTVKTLVSPVQK